MAREAPNITVTLDGEVITKSIIQNSLGESPVSIGNNIALETRKV